LTISDGLKKTHRVQKIAFLGLGIFLTSVLLLAFQPTVILAESKTDIADQFQSPGYPEVAQKLLIIEPISMDDLLTVNLIFDGRLPLHNSFILSNPPRFVIEFLDVGSAFKEKNLILKDDRVKHIHTQRHPGKLRIIFNLTSLDGISYLLKEDINLLTASFKIYAEQLTAQNAQLTEPNAISFARDESVRDTSGGKVEEKTGIALERKTRSADLEKGKQRPAHEFQADKKTLFDDLSISQSELDTLLQEPSISHSIFDPFFQEFSEGFSYELRALINQTVTEVNESAANPLNFLGVPKYIFEMDFRPDFYLNYRKLRLMAKPRVITRWTRIEDGIRDGESDWDNDVFLNEWIAGFQTLDSLFFSYGRENIQWGPSYLVSPSNPFFVENGLRNPKREVRGQDFGRAVWVPNSSWSFSFIANTDEGEYEPIDEFERAYALKIDYTGYGKYFSLIPSYREHDRERLGAYGGWTVIDGLLLYAEASGSQGNNRFYPVERGITFPSGVPVIDFKQTKDDSSSLEIISLFGVSYKFEKGTTLALEYLYNKPGFDDKQSDLIIDFYEEIGRIVDILPKALAQVLLDRVEFNDRDLPFLREHYLNFQFLNSHIWSDLDLSLRYTFNLDDESSQLIPIAQYDLNDHLQAYFVGTLNFGDRNSEFKLFRDDSYFFGLQFTF
jgi:hypothetical protein